ncbi:MAG: hypothetical protein ACHRXM_24130 [Isosphaerales bacterium]
MIGAVWLPLSPPEPIQVSSGTPNKQTVKAIEDTMKGKDVVCCEDVDDMFRKLGI